MRQLKASRKDRTQSQVCAIVLRWVTRESDNEARRKLEATVPDNCNLMEDSWDGTVHGIYNH
jgi:hypothetical protein